jgi:hypothetical protein
MFAYLRDCPPVCFLFCCVCVIHNSHALLECWLIYLTCVFMTTYICRLISWMHHNHVDSRHARVLGVSLAVLYHGVQYRLCMFGFHIYKCV